MHPDTLPPLDELRLALSKATPGEWWWYQAPFAPLLKDGSPAGPDAENDKFNGVGVGSLEPDEDYKVTAFCGDGPNGENNAILIALAKNALPQLLDLAALGLLVREELAGITRAVEMAELLSADVPITGGARKTIADARAVLRTLKDLSNAPD